MKESDPPELSRGVQIPFQPLQHLAILFNRLLQRRIGIQGYKVGVSPIKGIVTSAVGSGDRLAGDAMNGNVRRRLSRSIIVVPRRRKEWNVAHDIAVVIEVARLKLSERALVVCDVSGMQQE